MRACGVTPFTPAKRDEGQRNSRPLDDEYVIFLQGIPPQCRWQELKDFVRQTALHIRQAVVYDDCRGHPTGLGQIIVKNEDEAWRTFNRLSTNGWNGHSLTVTLSLATDPTKPIAGPTKSPLGGVPFGVGVTPAIVSSSSTCMPNTERSPRMPTSPTYTQTQEQKQVPYMNNLNGSHYMPFSPDSMYTMPWIFPNDNGVFLPYQTFYTSSFDFGQQARYFGCGNEYMNPYTNGFQHRHSVSTPFANHFNQGFGAPVSRNIFIHNLPWDTTGVLLKEHLRSAGFIERCEVIERKVGGATRTCANVTFRTKDEAKHAIFYFDNSLFRGVRIRVRFDRERGGSTGNIYHNNNANCGARSSGNNKHHGGTNGPHLNNNNNNNNNSNNLRENNNVGAGVVMAATVNPSPPATKPQVEAVETGTPALTNSSAVPSPKSQPASDCLEPNQGSLDYQLAGGACAQVNVAIAGLDSDQLCQQTQELRL
ncbi:hypothetical protein FQN57_000487 [Myotisia sp. PD_48]|nr:hypothetical protein FQN57_000487 [Myotisia sp. PD_48]